MNLRSMITELQDIQLLAQLDGRDLIAMEAKYHNRCQVNLRNRYRSLKRNSNQELSKTNDKLAELAFEELITHIEKSCDDGKQCFTLPEIHSLYVRILEESGTKKVINKHRLKMRLLECFPEALDHF